MIVLLIIAAVIATLVGSLAITAKALTWKQKRATTRVGFDKFIWGLQPLLHRLQPGATLAAHPNGRDGFLQLVLTGRDGDWREVEFGLPDADWSRPRFDEIVAELREMEADCEVESNPGNTDVPRLLRVWIGGGEAAVRDRATVLLHRAAAILGFPPEQTYNIDFRGSDHPEYIREVVGRMEADPRTPRFILRLTPAFRRQADEVEREMEARLRN